MEYRKLISFGKNSFVVSLPKSWVRRNNLLKGALVYVEEQDNNLLLGLGDRQEIQEKAKEISVDGKSVRRLKREIITAYIKDYKTITLFGEELKDKAVEIQNTVQNLMALEVMEQTSRKLVARDFLDMNNISIINLVRKIDVIIRAMMEDCEKMFVEDDYESIFHRDNDINRLTFLIFRVVEFGFNNSSYIYKKQNLNSHKLLTYWWSVFHLEAIGDDVKRIARYMRTTPLDPKQRERFIKLLVSAKENYLRVLKGFYAEDVELVHAVLDLKEKLISDCELFYQDNKKVENVGLLIERLKSMITGVYSLGRVIYQSDIGEK
ncbi:phosphate uptake regulator PhoU [Candidatus Woesearchaeota archaeon]|nr:phosphate uptake regulator PhoU [Candidatus Woesearchaeota archaeon]